MYSRAELIRLAAHKAVLRGRIDGRRATCAAALAGVLRPLVWLDRAAVLCQRFTPFAHLAAVPLALLCKRAFFPRVKIIRTLLRWGPPALFAARSLKRR